MRRRLLPLAAVLLLGLVPAPAAVAAGETTHAFMVDRAIDFLPPGPLKTLLSTQRLMALSGAAYPDSGYWAEQDSPLGPVEPRPSDAFGEVSHWERFVNAYVAHIRAKGCADLTDPAGPCAPLIAHVMGAAGHGLGDELWDWLFEPAMADHGEDPGQELLRARPARGAAGRQPARRRELEPRVRHGRGGDRDPRPLAAAGARRPPPVADLVAIYAEMGMDVTPEHILAGNAIGTAMMSAERAAAAEEGPRVQEDMPWSAANFVTEPGGVDDVGHAIDGYFGAHVAQAARRGAPAPRVSARYPAPGSTGVPAAGWLPARTAPGPSVGGAQHRILFALSGAVAPESLNPATVRLVDPGGADVPQLPGFPQAGPYGGDAGTHSVMLYPAQDLEPCARYTVVVTRGVRDILGTPLGHDVRWRFATACPG